MCPQRPDNETETRKMQGPQTGDRCLTEWVITVSYRVATPGEQLGVLAEETDRQT